jgi:NitT/TauT family transport system ATP-binding protein
VRVPLIAPCALGLGGNAITTSLALWDELDGAGASIGCDPRTTGAALRAVVAARARAAREPLTFAVVYPFSSHNYELRYWLAACGIDPDRDVRLVVIPPPFLVDALRAYQIDGFCAGEPWNSLAVRVGAGVIAAPTTDVWPGSGEKVLGCRREWAERHPGELAALIRAIYRAALWCGDPAHHAELAGLLAEPRHVGAPAELLRQALANRLSLAPRVPPRQFDDFFVTARQHATFPWTSHALWFYSQMVRWRQIARSDENTAAARSTYRPDLYRSALAPFRIVLPPADGREERFFDGGRFDPAAVETYLAELPR